MSILEYLIEEIDPTHELDLYIKENEETVGLDNKFISRLLNYIDSLFPDYGDLDNNINNELRKVMATGDGVDVKNVKKKIYNILMKCKTKILDNIKNKVEKIQVIPKQAQTETNMIKSEQPVSTQ